MKTCKLTVYTNKVLVEPWFSFLNKTCTASIVRTLYGYEKIKTGKDREITETALFCCSADQSQGLAYSGLLSRILTDLKKHGVSPDVHDMREPPVFDESMLDGISFRENQEEAMRKLLTSFNGICKAPPAFGKSFLIGHFCRIRNDKKIVVITSRQTVLKELHKRITDICKDRSVRLCNGSNAFKKDTDIVVCSAMSLHKILDDWPDIIVFDEVHGAAASSVGRSLMRFTKSQMFGFSATPKGRSDGADLINEALFGPVIFDISYHNAVSSGNVTPMYVRVVPVEGPVIDATDPLDLNRKGIWRNSIRNKKIAQVAKKLEEEGLQKILVMVNTAEHAYFLRAYMPDYKVVHAGVDASKAERFRKMGLLNKDEDPNADPGQIRTDFVNGTHTKVIATSIWKEGVDLVELECVIRADGMTGSIPSIQIGGRTSRISDGKERGLVIDFLDDFGITMENRSRTRIKHYKNEGWKVEDWIV